MENLLKPVADPLTSPDDSSNFTLEPYVAPKTDDSSSRSVSSCEHQKDKQSVAPNKSIDRYAHMRVLHCDNLSLSVNYENIFTSMKKFGIIERIRIRLSPSKSSFEAYIVYNRHSEAEDALEEVNSGNILDISNKAKLYSIRNFNDSDLDFVPKFSDLYDAEAPEPRRVPHPIWHLASYREGCQNLIKGSECLERKVGSIPKGNLKKYG